MEIWRLKDNLVTSLTFWGHVASSVTWPFDSRVDFLSVVHSDRGSIWHSYGDIAPQILDARTWTQKERRKNEKRKKKGEGKGREKSGKEKVREKGRRKGMKGKGKEKRIGKGKGKEKRREKEKGKRKKERNRGRKRRREGEKGKAKGKGNERWKKASLRNAGRTDARTHGGTDTKVILYSVQCHALHWKTITEYVFVSQCVLL